VLCHQSKPRDLQAKHFNSRILLFLEGVWDTFNAASQGSRSVLPAGEYLLIADQSKGYDACDFSVKGATGQ
jgi:hypothetical protein